MMGGASIITLAASPFLSFTHSSLLRTRHLSSNSKLWYSTSPLPRILWPSNPISLLPSAHFSALRAFNSDVTSGALLQDAGATALVMVGGYSLVSAFDFLTKRNLITQKLSRKVVHVLSGLLFMAAWPIFSTSMEARYFAAVVPLANCLRLLIYGLSLASNTGLVKSVTRDGKPEELLKGPLYYVLILMFCVLIFWRESPVGVISLSMMCGGDGFADIIGRRFGVLKLPHNQKKSWVGSISMFLFGFSISVVYGILRVGLGIGSRKGSYSFFGSNIGRIPRDYRGSR
eukprot:TRINITY_DN615_c0_g1_i1.p1 TRINITY_DN615_c0_g1~~TRINITY_DN615_c0_g1_i1.p1  ORF type:complete len:287 (+),score=18.33 TRINITY_DN615_c0_g1_i1:226-1086(+)